MLPLKALVKNLPFFFLASGGSQKSLASLSYGCIISISASTVKWFSFLHVSQCVVFSYKEKSLDLRPTVRQGELILN